MKLFVASTAIGVNAIGITSIDLNGQGTISCNIGDIDTPLFQIECDAEDAEMIVTINEDCRSQSYRVGSNFKIRIFKF